MMNKTQLRLEIQRLRRELDPGDIACFFKFDLDYQLRLIDGNLTPEEQKNYDYIENLSSNELNKLISKVMVNLKNKCRETKNNLKL